MAACDCGKPKGRHMNGCSSLESFDPSLSSKVKRALKEENPPKGGTRTPAARQAKQVITGRALKAQKQAAKKAAEEEKKNQGGT